jgi:hypothetical protein
LAGYALGLEALKFFGAVLELAFGATCHQKSNTRTVFAPSSFILAMSPAGFSLSATPSWISAT